VIVPNAAFPSLTSSNHRVTSPPTPRYNCIAWSAGDERRWWWPDPGRQAYWPADVPREETIDAFVKAYATLGYEPCESAVPEPGLERVALYARGEQPAHAARQLPNGKWSSKLGRGEDVEHDLEALEGPLYGSVVQVLRRPVL